VLGAARLAGGHIPHFFTAFLIYPGACATQ
jgi:hypothetical protein